MDFYCIDFNIDYGRLMKKKYKFFTFRQNNTGGSFVIDGDNGIGINVIIEAFDEYDALHIAETIDLYFDGNGDCECCGYRWDANDSQNHTKNPTIYDVDVSNGKFIDDEGVLHKHKSYIHYLNKPFKKVSHVKSKKRLK